MALTYQKFNTFIGDALGKVHDLIGATPGTDCDQGKCALSNTAPTATLATFSQITEITAGSGYTAGGELTGGVGANAAGTVTYTGTNITWTAAGGTIGPFQYIVHYNDTPTSPADPLINWWDRGAALTLQDGESYTIKFNGGASSGTIFTAA